MGAPSYEDLKAKVKTLEVALADCTIHHEGRTAAEWKDEYDALRLSAVADATPLGTDDAMATIKALESENANLRATVDSLNGALNHLRAAGNVALSPGQELANIMKMGGGSKA